MLTGLAYVRIFIPVFPFSSTVDKEYVGTSNNGGTVVDCKPQASWKRRIDINVLNKFILMWIGMIFEVDVFGTYRSYYLFLLDIGSPGDL
jgi:hypothetical protein